MLPLTPITEHNRDSLLAELVNCGLDKELPDSLMTRLATEDIMLPDMRHTMNFLTLCHQADRENDVYAHRHQQSLLKRLSAKGAYMINLARGEATPSMIKALESEMPKCFREEYKGLLPKEMFVAAGVYADKAHVVTTETDPEVNKGYHEVCDKLGIPPDKRPRLVKIYSDWPDASYISSYSKINGKNGSVVFSSNLQSILSPEQLYSVFAHELHHHKKSYSNAAMHKMKKITGNCTANYLKRREEYKADEVAVSVSSPQEYINALGLTKMRTDEYAWACRKVIKVLEECGVDIETEKEYLGLNTRGRNSVFKLMRSIFRTHPNMIDRFDNIAEDVIARN